MTNNLIRFHNIFDTTLSNRLESGLVPQNFFKITYLRIHVTEVKNI